MADDDQNSNQDDQNPAAEQIAAAEAAAAAAKEAEDAAKAKEAEDAQKAKEAEEAGAVRKAAEAAEAEKAKKKEDEANKDNQDNQDDPDNKDDQDDDGPELDISKWGDAGDETANSVMRLLQNSGMEPDRASELFMVTEGEGDDAVTRVRKPGEIDRAALEKELGKTRADLVMAGVENWSAKHEANVKAVLDTVHEAAGGKEQWETAIAWANKNIEQADRDILAGMINQGGLQAKLAAEHIAVMYSNAPDTNALSGVELKGDTSGGNTGEAISSSEYVERREAAQRKLSGPQLAKAIAALDAARARGRKQGK